MHSIVTRSSAIMSPQPDKEQLATFVRVLFKHATPGTIVSIRAFAREGRARIIRSFEIEPDDDLKSVIVGATYAAREAALNSWVFSPPVATFKDGRSAKESNLAEGFCITVELDEHPQDGLATLSKLIGKPTMIVESGGRWTNPETGDVEPKLHLYWVLKTPARDEAALTKLKQARELATAIVGADPSCVPVVHPLRWCGSWHLKDPANPRLCHIIGEIGKEIDLDHALDVLRQAAPSEAVIKAAKVKHTATERTKPKNVFQEFGSAVSALADIKTLTSAMQFVPNPDVHWKVRNDIGLALHRSTGGSDAGYQLFVEFSKRSKEKFDEAETRDRWENYHRSPADRIGPGFIYRLAEENGWERYPDKTAAVVEYVSLNDAREKLGREIRRFVNYHKRKKNCFELFAEEITGRAIVRVIGMPVDMAVGKSYAATAAIAESSLRFFYGVPTTKLGREIVNRLTALGVDAELYLGREQDDPENDGHTMCLKLGAVADAMKAMQPVQTACCKSSKHECEFYSTCGYQKQLQKKPRVWVAASDMLFHRNRLFSKTQFVFIDEGFEDKALRGVEGKPITVPIVKTLCKSLDLHRRELGLQLLEQADDGYLRLATILGSDQRQPLFGGDDLHKMKIAEWNRYKELSKALAMKPGSRGPLRGKERNRVINEIVITRRIIDIIGELQNMVDNEIKVSGRLEIETVDDVRHIVWRGLAPISKHFRTRPMIYTNATMPPKEILKHLLPKIEIMPGKPVRMPDDVYTLQVRKAPMSREKLIRGEHVEGHRQEMRLRILQSWMEVECQPTLVVAQKEFAKWLRAQNLPKNISVEHYNAVAGVNTYEKVRLQILIGRTLPGAEAVEVRSGTISGAAPDIIVDKGDQPFAWYPTEPKGIQLRDGRQRMVSTERHPDPLCEANRFLITEGAQMQAFGRARPLLRDSSSPLRNELLFDNALPTVVDKVITWKPPSRFIETAASDGMMLLSPVDLVRIWPKVWTSLITARRDVADGVPTLPGFVKVTYRPMAPKAKRRVGFFHTVRIPDVAAALEKMLGVPVEIAP